MNETMVTVTGNVAGDVIARRVGPNQEHELVTFRVASSERRWDKATETWIDGDRFTASVNCWRRLADGARCLTKGDPVIVTGRLSVREYEAEGVRRYMTEISAVAVGPDLARCTAKVHRWRPGAGEAGEVGVATEVGDATADQGVVGASPAVTATGVDGDLAAVGLEAGAEGATITGIDAGERRRSGAARASA
ncbi:single-stranded DNA-binding protein [Actinomycetospora straminea]|uniref:Single-stranded DNA-binding protein n=1 Tax=Actinomycetospora straminea TaxID=663607 RepID=A0ABP9FBS8_9PSEU|nr:single-stranded DNA-binding protein [Actinomycetospora straminea]MDD7936769.1 single-stranded DNA-binding protein [Actinomycetospora straminea]